MASEAVLYVEIIPTTKGAAKRVVGEFSGAFDQVESKGSGVLSKLGNGIRNFAAGTVAAIGTIATTALAGGLGRLLNIEDATAKLKGLGNSAETVQTIMDNALASVRGTAFGLDSAATVAAAAVAAGIQPGEQLTRVLKTVADTATIAGASMEDTGLIFNSVAARGKLQGDDLMQLQARGVPVLMFLAKHYGVTAQAASEMVSKGEVDFANFAAAIEANLGGAALQSGNTTRGAFANMMASLSRIGANLLSGVFPMFKETFLGITEALAPLEDKAKVIGQVLQDKLVPAFEWFLEKIRGGGEAIPGLTSLLGPLSGAFLALGAGALPGLLAGLPAIGPMLSKLLGPLSALGGPVGILIGAFAGLLAVSPELREALGVLGSTVMTSLGAVFQQLSPVISQIGTELAGFAQTVGVVLADAITTLAPVLGQIIGLLGDLAAQLLPMLIPVIQQLAGIFSELVAAAMPVVEDILGVLVTVLKAIIPVVLKVVEAFLPLVMILLDALMPIITALLPLISLIVQAIAPLVIVLVEALAPILTIVAQILEAVLIPVLNVLVAVIGWVAGVVADWLTGLTTGTGTAASIFQGIGDVIAAIFQGIGAVFTWLYETIIKPVFDAIGAVISWWWTSIIEPIAKLVMIAVGLLAMAFQAAYEAVIKPALDALAVAFTWLYENSIKPVGDWIALAIQAIGIVFTWLYENAVKPVLDAVAAVFTWLWETILKPVFDAIGLGVQIVGDAVGAVFGTVGDIIRGAFEGVVGFVKGIFNGIIDAVNGVIGAINAVAGPVGDFMGMDLHLGYLPRLARGGVVQSTPGGIPAVIGEGRYDEAVLPLGGPMLDRIREALVGPDGRRGGDLNLYVTNPVGEPTEETIRREAQLLLEAMNV